MTSDPGDTGDPAPRLSAAELSAHISARLCHDLISPVSAIVSGLDLIGDPSAQDMRAEAMALVDSSARKLADMLAFSRVAFGASASAQTFDPRELRRLTEGVFAHIRAELVWSVEAPQMGKAAARAVLNLAQMGGAALPTGGQAKVRAAQEGLDLAIAVEATGARARLRPEVLSGLRGGPPGEGPHGHWAQARYVALIIEEAGGRVFADIEENKVSFVALLPS